MDEFDDFIEVDDNDLMLGDQHLKLDTIESNDKKEEKKEEPSKNKVEQNTDSDLLEVDDTLLNPQEEVNEDEDEGEQTLEDDSKEDTSEDGNDEEKEVTNEFAIFGGALAEKGFFPDIEEEALNAIENEDDISDLLIKQLNTTFANWKDGYKRNLVPNLVKEGYIDQKDVSDKLPEVYTDDQIKESIDVAKNVIRKYYKRTNVPDREIERIIESRDDLEESALELNKLNEQLDTQEQATLAAKIKQQEEQAATQRQAFNEELKKNTLEYSEFIPGRKLRPQEKETVFMNIEPTLKKINSNLVKYGPILAYLDKYDLLEAKFDKIINEGKTKGVSALGKVLSEKKRSTSKGTTSRKTGVINIDDTDVPNLYR